MQGEKVCRKRNSERLKDPLHKENMKRLNQINVGKGKKGAKGSG